MLLPKSLTHGSNRQVVPARVPLTWWQVDFIGLLIISEEYLFTMTCVDTANGLLAVYPVWHSNQLAVAAALDKLCAVYEYVLIIESD
jgi:hypothetical protein